MLQTNSAFFQNKLECCLQHNVLHYKRYHCQRKLFNPSCLLILFKVFLCSEHVLKQKFKPICLKLRYFHGKIEKIAQPLTPPAVGSYAPPTPTVTLSLYELFVAYLIYNRRFHVT